MELACPGVVREAGLCRWRRARPVHGSEVLRQTIRRSSSLARRRCCPPGLRLHLESRIAPTNRSTPRRSPRTWAAVRLVKRSDVVRGTQSDDDLQRFTFTGRNDPGSTVPDAEDTRAVDVDDVLSGLHDTKGRPGSPELLTPRDGLGQWQFEFGQVIGLGVEDPGQCQPSSERRGGDPRCEPVRLRMRNRRDLHRRAAQVVAGVHRSRPEVELGSRPRDLARMDDRRITCRVQTEPAKVHPTWVVAQPRSRGKLVWDRIAAHAADPCDLDRAPFRGGWRSPSTLHPP